MEVRSIRVGDSVTINLGNYESRKLNLEIELVVGPAEDPKSVALKGFNSVRKMLNDQVEAHYPNKG